MPRSFFCIFSSILYERFLGFYTHWHVATLFRQNTLCLGAGAHLHPGRRPALHCALLDEKRDVFTLCLDEYQPDDLCCYFTVRGYTNSLPKILNFPLGDGSPNGGCYCRVKVNKDFHMLPSQPQQPLVTFCSCVCNLILIDFPLNQ